MSQVVAAMRGSRGDEEEKEGRRGVGRRRLRLRRRRRGWKLAGGAFEVRREEAGSGADEGGEDSRG
jgi:hypothetical protein